MNKKLMNTCIIILETIILFSIAGCEIKIPENKAEITGAADTTGDPASDSTAKDSTDATTADAMVRFFFRNPLQSGQAGKSRVEPVRSQICMRALQHHRERMTRSK